MKANVTVHPYHMTNWKGWAVAIGDPATDELWHRPFYYKADAEQLAKELEGRSLEDILETYGAAYFERIR